MIPTGRPAKTYHSHRENQRERILEVAERLFIRDGIDRVSLSDIARAARITRNTLYEYFPSKQEVAWAILQNIFAQGRAGSTEPSGETGLERIEQFMLGMVSRVEEQSEHLRFIVEFNTLYAREANPERMRQVTARASGEDPLARLIRQGIQDGTLRPDLDPSLAAAAAWNLVSGLNSRFALLGDLISQEYDQPVKDIYLEVCRIFLRGIRSSPSVEESTE